MISDFSGIIFDYAFLFDKPVLYVTQKIDMRPYDADDLYTESGGPTENLWQFKTVQNIGVELKEEMFDSIADVIKTMTDSTELKTARQQAKAEAWQYEGEAGKRVADFMIRTVNENSAKNSEAAKQSA
jgi:CDP-glycerol glycerophosphotransferase (TagB/SpsB family)